MILKDAIRLIPETECTGNIDVPVQGIAYDSRSVKKGDLFVAVRGEKTDGACYIAEAIAKGAAAVASEKATEDVFAIPYIRVNDARKFLAEVSHAFYCSPCFKLKLAAVTGTKGKTTIVWLIDSILAQAGLASCLAGTIEMRIGNERFVSIHTTPEAPDIDRFFRDAAERGCTHGALEVSSHALALKRVYGAKFTVGVFTNLSHDHLDFHGDMETYYQAKKILFTPENGNEIKAAVINIDDSYGRRLADEVGVPVITFGFQPSADIHVKDWRQRLDGTDLVLNTPGGELIFHSRLVGRTNVYNIMAATGASLKLGLTGKQVCVGVDALSGVPGRMERVDGGQDFLVVVDYAHTPASLENLLETARQLPHRKLITIFGCGGDRDRAKRPVMGEIAARLSDIVIVTSDNPRSEDPAQIINEIESGIEKGAADCRINPDRRAAIREAINMAGRDDIVIIAGKGHETYQIVGDRKLHFDDREIAREALITNYELRITNYELLIGLTAGGIESAVKGALARGSRDVAFSGVSIDSRTVAPGEIFFAIRGPRTDGHKFIADVQASGATGAIVADDYAPSGELPENFVLIRVKDTHEALKALARAARLSWNGKLTAVTGSVGKTTVREFAYQLINTRFKAYQTPGNYNNLFGLPLALLGLRPEHEIGIFEMGMSAAGEIAEMCGIALPETGILTNVAPAHLEFFASIEQIAEAKGELVNGLAPDGTLIYNADDPLVCKLSDRFNGKKISFGLSKDADIRADNIEIRDLGSTRFRLSCGDATLKAMLPFAGKHYVMNALPGVALALSLGLTPEEIVPMLGRLQQAKMRGKILRSPEGFAVIDDSYNSSPRALQSMIEVLAAAPGFSRRILFAGEMLELGPSAPQLHYECGEFAVKYGIDMIVGVGGNAGAIVRAAEKAGKIAHFFETSEEAAKFAEENIRSGDLVLVKGSRGIHMEIIVSGLIKDAPETIADL